MASGPSRHRTWVVGMKLTGCSLGSRGRPFGCLLEVEAPWELFWGLFRASLGLLGASWRPLWGSWAPPGTSWGPLGAGG
eukprot:3894688-Pyramimonas_sp.AAC.1